MGIVELSFLSKYIDIVKLIQCTVGSMVGVSLIHNMYPKFSFVSTKRKVKYAMSCIFVSYLIAPGLVVLAKRHIDLGGDNPGITVAALVISCSLLPLAAYVSKFSDLDAYLSRLGTRITRSGDLHPEEKK